MPFHPQAIFFLTIGTVRAKDIRKSVHILQVEGSTPVPPTPTAIRVVLLHKKSKEIRCHFVKTPHPCFST